MRLAHESGAVFADAIREIMMALPVMFIRMEKRSFTRLKAHRMRWSLSEADLARLLGFDRSRVSRIEGGEAPSVSFVLGCEVIFGATPCSIFPRAYERVEEEVMRRAAVLDRQLAGKHDASSIQKRELLAEMVRRTKSNARYA